MGRRWPRTVPGGWGWDRVNWSWLQSESGLLGGLANPGEVGGRWQGDAQEIFGGVPTCLEHEALLGTLLAYSHRGASGLETGGVN